jgi:transposase
MKHRKVYRFRIHPTKAQEGSLYRIAGARRFVYNWVLERRKSYYVRRTWQRYLRETTLLGVDGSQE